MLFYIFYSKNIAIEDLSSFICLTTHFEGVSIHVLSSEAYVLRNVFILWYMFFTLSVGGFPSGRCGYMGKSKRTLSSPSALY